MGLLVRVFAIFPASLVSPKQFRKQTKTGKETDDACPFVD
jgi:hypothetical protein